MSNTFWLSPEKVVGLTGCFVFYFSVIVSLWVKTRSVTLLHYRFCLVICLYFERTEKIPLYSKCMNHTSMILSDWWSREHFVMLKFLY